MDGHEVMTREQWLTERRTGIGGSDVAAILGMSRFATPLDVYLDKKGLSESREVSEQMLWGTLLEPIVRDQFCSRTGFALREMPPLIRSETHPFMVASLDGMTDHGEIVEVKTAGRSDGWGEDGSDEIPPYYHTQVCHYLAVTGARIAYVPVLIGGQDFRIYQVGRDETFIENVIEAERAFWHDHVLAGVPPEATNAADASRLWRRDNGEAIEVDVGTADIIARLKSLKEDRRTIDEQVEFFEDALKVTFRDAASVTHGGNVLATYKAQSRRSLDAKSLEKDHPEIAESYRRESTFRVLRLK